MAKGVDLIAVHSRQRPALCINAWNKQQGSEAHRAPSPTGTPSFAKALGVDADMSQHRSGHSRQALRADRQKSCVVTYFGEGDLDVSGAVGDPRRRSSPGSAVLGFP